MNKYFYKLVKAFATDSKNKNKLSFRILKGESYEIPNMAILYIITSAAIKKLNI